MLSDFEIEEFFRQKFVYIEPFNRDQLNPNSYDVRLGNHFWVYQRTRPLEFSYKYLEDDDFMEMLPNQFILAHTKEYIGSIAHCAPMLETKSTVARKGLSVHQSAGFGDVGFHSRWTLELVTHIPFVLRPNMKIAQIAWVKVDPTIRKYDKPHYQPKKWTAYHMLPKDIQDDHKKIIINDVL